jgi:uncharacterized protein (TIGR03437 family)
LVNSDTSSAYSGAPSYSTNATLTSGNPNAGSWTITPAIGTLTAANYSFSFATGTLTVGKASLTITANAKSKIYGSVLTFAGTEFTPTGLQNGDTVTSATLISSGTVATAGVGGYTITPSNAVGGNLGNYTITYANGTLTVTGATLTVNPSGSPRAYGGQNTLNYSISGFVNTDTVAVVTGTPNLSTTASASSSPGSYPVSATIGTLSAANYIFSFATGSMTITQAQSAISLSALAPANSAPLGQSFTLTYTVQGAPGLGVASPSGVVSYIVDGGAAQAAPISNGVAVAVISGLAGGAHVVLSSYAGDTNYLGTTLTAFTLTVTKGTAQVTVTPTPGSTIQVGQSVTLTIAVTGVGTTTVPTGTVSCSVDGGAAQSSALTAGSGTITVSNLATGTHTAACSYSGDATFQAASASSLTLTVTVAPVNGTLTPSVPSMLFNTTAGVAPATQTFTISNVGTLTAAGFTVTASTTKGGAWLSATPTTGVTPATITVTALASVGGTALAQGGYNGTITIAPLQGAAATNTVTLPVGLAVSAPAIEPGGVVSAAIFNATVSPGSIVSLFGVNLSTGTAVATSTPLPTTLSGTSVTVTGTTTAGAAFSGSAPLFYVSPLQINAQVPPGLTGTVTLTVVSGTTTGVTTTVTISAVSPGIFVANGTQGAILNADFSANSSANAALVGSTILIYATGLGPTNPPLAAGQPGASAAPLNVTVNTVTATINNLPATVVFAGAAPGFVGLFQVNATIPAGTPAGSSIPVQLSVTGVQSNTVTMCVRTQ